jgi:hypothetical protein
MILEEHKMIQFVIEQFMGCNVNLDRWDGIMPVIKKIEQQTNNGKENGIPLKTHLDRLENDGVLEQHQFCIEFNQHPKYVVKGSTKEYCTIMALYNFCKDWYITNQMEKKRK